MDIAEAARRLCLVDVDDDLLDRAKELNRLAVLRAKPHVRPRVRTTCAYHDDVFTEHW